MARLLATVALYAALVFFASSHSMLVFAQSGCYGMDEAPTEELFNFGGLQLHPQLPSAPVEELVVDTEKGYRLDKVAEATWSLLVAGYFSMIVATDDGVALFDVPPTHAPFMATAIAEISDKPIKYLVYSHAHTDHIAGAGAALNATDSSNVEIISSEPIAALLEERNDPNRPLVTASFDDKYTFEIGGVTVELSLANDGHQVGDIFSYLPKQKVVYVVDILFPGWVPPNRLAVTTNVKAYVAAHDLLLQFDADTYVAGHLTKLGTREDVLVAKEFLVDLEAAALFAIGSIGTDILVEGNIMFNFNMLIRSWEDACYEQLEEKWEPRLAGFQVWTRADCHAMVFSLNIDI